MAGRGGKTINTAGRWRRSRKSILSKRPVAAKRPRWHSIGGAITGRFLAPLLRRSSLVHLESHDAAQPAFRVNGNRENTRPHFDAPLVHVHLVAAVRLNAALSTPNLLQATQRVTVPVF